MYKYVRVHQWHNVHIEFLENQSTNLKSEREIHVQAHTQYDLIHLPLSLKKAIMLQIHQYTSIVIVVNTGKYIYLVIIHEGALCSHVGFYLRLLLITLL
jgi:hypothetical protein